jgi:hypothetical protein
MANIQSSKGYSSSYRGSNCPGAFYAVFTGDFGEPIPGAPTLAYEAGTGSLATGTAFVQIAWITAQGVSLPSVEVGVAITASTGGALVTIPAVPTSGAPVIGWQLFSAGSTATEGQNRLTTDTKQASVVSIPTTEGAQLGFPIATTHVVLANYGGGAAPAASGYSGVQPALPSIAAVQSVDYDFIVPNSGSLWKTYKPVGCIRPDSINEVEGITLSSTLDCIAPLYPGATPGASTYTQVSVAIGTYFVMNGTLFVSTSGTNNTATTFIGGGAFNVAKGVTVTDGSVTWLCLGKAVLVRAHFANVTAGALTPVAQEYDLFQL